MSQNPFFNQIAAIFFAHCAIESESACEHPYDAVLDILERRHREGGNGGIDNNPELSAALIAAALKIEHDRMSTTGMIPAGGSSDAAREGSPATMTEDKLAKLEPHAGSPHPGLLALN